MGIKMTNGGITIEVFSGVDVDLYKRAGYTVVVVTDESVPAPEPVPSEEIKPLRPEEKNAAAISAVNAPKKAAKK